METNEMTFEERLVYFATAPRATAKRVDQIIDGEVVSHFGGRLRGTFVRLNDEPWKKETKEEALELAKEFRKRSYEKAKDRGLL